MRNIRIHHLILFLNANHKTQLFSARARGRNGKSNTQTTVKAISAEAIQRILHASDLYLNIWSCWNTDRATTSTGKPVSILHGIAEKSVSLSGTEFVQRLLFRLLHYFCTDSPWTRHKSVKIFIKCFSSFYCALFCLVSIFRRQSLLYKTYC